MDFHPSLRKSQQGSAIVFAMGLCTLVVILATSMILSLHHDMRRYDRLKETVLQQTTARSVIALTLSMLAKEDAAEKETMAYEITLNDIMLHVSLTNIDKLTEEAFLRLKAPLIMDIPGEALNAWLKYEDHKYLGMTQLKTNPVTTLYTLLARTENGWQVIYQSEGVR